MSETPRPKLAIWKFASCDGCQLSLLDCEDELLTVAGAVDVAQFLEMTSRVESGPYDLSLVEGSITTASASSAARTLPSTDASDALSNTRSRRKERNGRAPSTEARNRSGSLRARSPGSTPRGRSATTTSMS